ncbi:hypothetical protein AMD00_15855 [Viridibacillus arvi]|jgi:hypothetical protein|uniref:Uncharacterized protein n=1 Tax=Viridibacillus arvi TaxID=263475 RepID=A0A0M0LGF4_9BACL|nr:hypothetical protein AMD00_15855 [Viridibacillus arvi]
MDLTTLLVLNSIMKFWMLQKLTCQMKNEGIALGIIKSKDNRTLSEQCIKASIVRRVEVNKIPKKVLYTQVLPHNASRKIQGGYVYMEVKG